MYYLTSLHKKNIVDRKKSINLSNKKNYYEQTTAT
ncbi:MAG: hypothetical protein RJA25_2142 [Bacteroidota bacterium]|jgi:hypothetical protein